jgi:hypothetical protein
MKFARIMGAAVAVLGVTLLLFTFFEAFSILQSYESQQAPDFMSSVQILLLAAVKTLFLGIMGWIASTLIVRGINYEKIERDASSS